MSEELQRNNFKGVSSKKTEMLNPLIDQKYDELYTVCEKANALLN